MHDLPKPGDEIYVETELHLSHGVDDLRGGKATVTRVTTGVSAGREVPFVEVAENPGSSYNWEMLAGRQSALAAQFGERRAHADPDVRPEFNDRVVRDPLATRGWESSTAARTGRAVYLLFVVALIVFALDRWSKFLILSGFMPGESRLAIPHLLWWTYVQNTHGAFGLFGNSPILLIVLALIVLGVFAHAFRDAVQRSNVIRVAFGMILGGAVGNIVDRFLHSWVVDFIDFRTIWPNVFNVADACITVGVALLVLASLQRERRA